MTIIFVVKQQYGEFEDYQENILCAFEDEPRAHDCVQYHTTIAEQAVKLQSEFNTVVGLKRHQWTSDYVTQCPLTNDEMDKLTNYLKRVMIQWLVQQGLTEQDANIVIDPMSCWETSTLEYCVQPIELIQ